MDFEAYAQVYGQLTAAVLADLDANHEFWEQYEGRVAKAQEAVNDAYLKANGQSEGVKTYGRVVDLMLVEFVRNK